MLTLWLVALPGFLYISYVFGNVNVMCIVITAAHSLLILCSVEAILIAQWAQWSAGCKMWNHSTNMYQCTDTRASGIMGYCPHLLKCQVFWSINSILKELYCISEAPVDVLKINMWFIIWDLNFPIEQWFTLCQRVTVHVPVWMATLQDKCSVGFSMILQSQGW